MWTIRCNAISLIESVGCYYPDINTDYNKKRIKQIKKIVAGLLEKKNQKQGIREEDANKLSKLPYAKRIDLLQKLMKPIREPKFGLTLNDLAGVFCPGLFNPDETLNDNASRKALNNMRRLIKRVNKRHDNIFSCYSL